MRVAVVSDVHGNLHALEAVLEAVDAEQPDAVWCLGDLVGYGPRPNECCALVRRRADVCLAGNHDLAVLGHLDLDEFTDDAAAAARWSHEELAPEEREFLETLEPSAELDEAALYHGSARSPIWEYVLDGDAAAVTLELADAPLVLVGHSHIPIVARAGDARHAPGGTEIRLSPAPVLLNPGGVGQPRDADPRAAWLLLDFEAGRASFRREKYDVLATQMEIWEAGLPRALGDRLAYGV